MVPEVSVIIPMRNAERYVAQALASVLLEKDVSLEVIVVDDGSTDGSASVVNALAEPRVMLLPGPGHGIAACFNTGLARARGQIIMRCDADDLYAPGRIGRQVAWLKAHPEFDAVCGRFATIDAKGRFVCELGKGEVSCDITEELRRGVTRTSFCTFAVRVGVLRRIGGFREFFVTGEDIDCQLRLGDQGPVWFDDTVCYFYRLHDASITHQQRNNLLRFFDEAARTFQKQRQKEGRDALQQGALASLPDSLSRGAPQDASAHLQGMLIGKAWKEHAAGKKLQAVRTGMAALRYQPTRWGAWKSVFALLIKTSHSPAGIK